MIAEVDIEYKLQSVLGRVKHLIAECEEEGLTNTQYFIEFEDELNRLSCKDHNKIMNNNLYMD